MNKRTDLSREDYLTMNRLCLSASLRRTERLVTRHYDARLANAGVTAVQLPILSIIAAVEYPTFRLLAEQLELDRSTLSRNLTILERDGLVELGAPSGPKPGKLALTRRGRDALRRAHKQWQKAHGELVDALESRKVDEGLAFLKTLRAKVRGGR
ncbi:MAG TPA: MarR family winged helix-turn-helix transcriptional regulator [Thermoanaerobaculia bacterium]|nr:MarR family winged helix-turn-helix transcriptional regulator [Thermoanaerobaculia bacterium]